INIGEGTPFSLSQLQKIIEDFRPRLVGFSTYQRNIFYVLGLAKAIKGMDSEIKTVIGGPQATFMPSSALEDGPIDFICREEGEIAFLSIAGALRDEKTSFPVPGCSCKLEDGCFHDGPSIIGYSNLDEYPSPYLTDGLIDFSKMEEAIMLTSRGCPYNCIFCYTPNAFKRKVRFHSIERVVEEIEWVLHKGVKKFWFADPSFSINMERVDQLMERILRKNLKGEIWLETRADLIDEEMLKKMKAAGVTQVAYGLESASEKVLFSLKKKISLDHIRSAIKLTQKHGMDIELFTQYGLPNETFGDAMMTLKFLKDNNILIRGNSNSQQTQIYFGTELFDLHEKYGIRPLEKRIPQYLSIGDQYETSCLSAADIQKIKAIWEKESLDGVKRKVS
ncbi:MAG: B12-binding domain-containing radical SAM protein, partial [Deltaproteobacteria bacterium]|nr:B12-binding domain-containing radical SAM protein [Deltaproteobacteria bacterium]